MRLIDADKLKSKFNFPDWGDCVRERIDATPTVIYIPDEATNGDVIKAIFPTAKVIAGYDIMYVMLKETLETLPVSKDFWNAKYGRHMRICPRCHGEGGWYGTDGVDWRTCVECHGTGEVAE